LYANLNTDIYPKPNEWKHAKVLQSANKELLVSMQQFCKLFTFFAGLTVPIKLLYRSCSIFYSCLPMLE